MKKLTQITRFSLYGFLKNQTYFTPFFILILKHIGLSFFEIGILFAVRDLTTNLLEIPSGLIADLGGKIKSLYIAWIAYILSFVLFAFSSSIVVLFFASIFMGVGEAFRSGTHKAIIFDWLRETNQTNKRTEVYGYTRSWSQIGSAGAVLISAFIALRVSNLRYLFVFTLIPYVLGIINFYFYPKYKKQNKNNIYGLGFLTELFKTFKNVVSNVELKWLFIESVGFVGLFQIIQPYLQIILLYAGISGIKKVKYSFSHQLPTSSVIFIAIGFAIFHILSAFSSRNAYKVVKYFKSEERASSFLWIFNLIVFSITLILLIMQFYLSAGISFIFLSVTFNMWRPIFLARIDKHSDNTRQATVLSIESQFKTLFKIITAPTIGYLTDVFGITAPIAVGVLVSLFFVVRNQIKIKSFT